ncbi:serine protease [Rubripirellula amarantea]|nr:serine protease [Rubripirellula amarantea]
MGGEAGTTVDVTISGELLEDSTALLFSHSGITAVAKTDAEGAVIANQFTVTISEDCPLGVHDARVLTPYGVSTARAFSVGHLKEIVQTETSTTIDSAVELPINCVCNAYANERNINHYRIHVEKGQRIIVDCSSAGIDSKLTPVLIIADSQGNDLVAQRRGDYIDFTAPTSANYLVKVHDLTFRGGPFFFFRLRVEELEEGGLPEATPRTQAVGEFSWPPDGLAEQASSQEAEPNDSLTQPQRITIPCDISGSFYPAADVDRFEFVAKKGQTWWVEVASERLGRPTNASVLVQRVVATEETADSQAAFVDLAELADIDSPIKRSSNFYTYDGPPYNAGSSDVLGKFEVPEDGTYHLQLVDLFGGTRSDERNKYRLVIRQAQPDFAVVAWAMHMELRNGDRNALSKPVALRPGTTIPFEVIAIRRDGFDGPIDIRLDDLPDGVRADGLRIPAGQSRGHLLITAMPDAPVGNTVATFTGEAEVDGRKITRQGRIASLAWPIKDHSSEVPSPRLMADIPVSVGEAEISPLVLAPKSDDVLEVKAGEKITVPVVHLRAGEFSGASMLMKTMGTGFESNPTFDLTIADDVTNVELDLAKLKTPPGDYAIAFYGGAVAKYASKQTPDKPVDTVDLFVSQPIAIRVLAGDPQ